jgi:hypothetical protein
MLVETPESRLHAIAAITLFSTSPGLSTKR